MPIELDRLAIWIEIGANRIGAWISNTFFSVRGEAGQTPFNSVKALEAALQNIFELNTSPVDISSSKTRYCNIRKH